MMTVYHVSMAGKFLSQFWNVPEHTANALMSHVNLMLTQRSSAMGTDPRNMRVSQKFETLLRITKL
jgi:hypothetical protein